MEWWEFPAWVVTTLVAAGGLLLGIRAELRASKYRPHWDVDDDRSAGAVSVTNRTGETAKNVAIVRHPAGREELSKFFPIIADGETVQAAIPSSFDLGVLDPHIWIRWDRATNGHTYRWDDLRVDGRTWSQRLREGFAHGKQTARRARPGGRRLRS